MSTQTTATTTPAAIAQPGDEEIGARYLLADLQVHTPVDARFKPPPDSDEPAARRKLARDYLAAAHERGVRLVGITEHNDVSWIDDLRYAARGLGMYLLPGFEVETSEGIHVLCLFDPDTPLADLEDTLAQLGLTKSKRRQNRLELRANRDFGGLIRFVQEECSGICIAAHIESNKGLLAALREGARVEAWKTPAFGAAQLAKPPDQVESGNGRIIRGEEPIYERDRLPAYILTSDARTIQEIGTSPTWIKMDSVSVEGLRQAFLDPGSRISYEDPAQRRTGGRLLAAAWDGGFLGNVSFALNPELNCLIGGKGAGKSTVVETIRFAFGLDYRTPEVEAAGGVLLDAAFTSGSKVSLLVETEEPAPKRYLIERTAPHAPVVRDPLTGEAHPELEPIALVRPCVYGQKEIYGIAQDAHARLEMLDGFAEDELRGPLERERDLRTRCGSNGRVIVDAQRRIDDAETKLAELPRLDLWRTRFREAGFEEKLRERRQLDREDRLLKAAEQALEERLTLIEELDSQSVAVAATLETAESDLPNADVLTAAGQTLARFDQSWKKGIAGLRSAITNANAALAPARSQWTERREASAAKFDAALRELQNRMPEVDPERYLDVERRIEQLMPLRGVQADLEVKLRKARQERGRLLADLTDARGEKHRARKRAAERLNEELAGSVRVELDYQGEREPFVERLTELRSGARVDGLRRMVEHEKFSPEGFARALRERQLTAEFGLPQGQATNLERALDEAALLDLETVELPDAVQLSLDLAPAGAAREYRDLSQLSPGQKSTAILLLIMQESRDPLIVDQPEDDLDNRFIYDDIVTRLRAAKPSRQFMVATHNANIPVSGDAEQIVVLDAREVAGRVRGSVQELGSIDNPGVRVAAEQILEGGEQAFRLRREKYHL